LLGGTLNDIDLLVGQAVQLANQLVDPAVGGVDLALTDFRRGGHGGPPDGQQTFGLAGLAGLNPALARTIRAGGAKSCRSPELRDSLQMRN
jgi:hypothetical protein